MDFQKSRSQFDLAKEIDTNSPAFDGNSHNGNSHSGEEGVEFSDRESNAAIAGILESITDAFVALDSSFRFRYANREAERILGRPRQQLLGNSVYDLFPGFVDSVFDREYRRAISHGIKVDFEAFYEPDGVWIEAHVYPSSDGLTVYFKDVTERRRALESLRASNERFQLAQKAANMTTWDWNMVTGDVTWSSNAGAVYGSGSDRFDMLYESWIEVVVPEDRTRVEKQLREAIDGKADYDSEYRIRTGDGSIRWLAARGKIYYDPNGVPQRMLGVNIDITERKQAEEALRTSEQTYRSLFETMTQGVIYYDASCRVISANPAAQQILGVELEQIRGHNIASISKTIRENGSAVPESMHPALLAFETGREVKNIILGVFNPKEGQIRWMKVDAVPQFRPGELSPFQGYIMFDDITERKRAQEVMRISEKLAATGRLAASIAHEINNPLESITNLLYLLEHEPSLPQQSRSFAMMAQQELSRVTHIARQTLAFYRDTSRPVPVSVPSLIENVLELYHRKIESKRLQVDCSFEVEEQIPAFPGELRQVFSNLIVNAIESVPEGGRVRIHVFHRRRLARTGTRGIEIIVADNGPGIAPEYRKRVFEPFFTTKGEKGTGLGLWVSHGIVEKHGGVIRLRSSTSPGRTGTVFSVFLPFRGQRLETSAAA